MHTAEAATPGAHVGDVERLEQPLHDAVLAERAMQQRERRHLLRAVRSPGVKRELLPLVGASRRRGDLAPRAPGVRRRAAPRVRAAPEESETSCSEDRPPASTATVIGSGAELLTGGSPGGHGEVVVVVVTLGAAPITIVTVVPLGSRLPPRRGSV